MPFCKPGNYVHPQSKIPDLKSLFDTGIGKTVVAAGLARMLDGLYEAFEDAREELARLKMSKAEL